MRCTSPHVAFKSLQLDVHLVDSLDKPRFDPLYEHGKSPVYILGAAS